MFMLPMTLGNLNPPNHHSFFYFLSLFIFRFGKPKDYKFGVQVDKR